jgi:hypothetical protein
MLVETQKRIAVTILILVTISLSVSHGQVMDKPDQNAADECSRMGVVLANWQALIRGDVLIKVTSTFDNVLAKVKANEGGVKGAAFTSIELRRFVFDFDLGKHLQANVTSLNGVQILAAKDVELLSKSIEAKFADFEKATVWSIDDESRLRASKSMIADKAKFLQKMDIIDLRGIWPQAHYGRFFSARLSYELRTRWWEQCRSCRNYARSKLDSNGNHVLQFTVAYDESQDISTYVTISEDNQMPIEIKEVSVDRKTGLKMHGGSTKIQWTELNGVFVPISIRTEKGHSVSINGHKESGLITHEVTLHWFSVNEKLDEKTMTSNRVASKQKVFELVDPLENNATSLLPPTKGEVESR